MNTARQVDVERMLADIREEARYTRRLTGRDTLDARVMQAMASVPRDAFVPDDLQAAAFDNGPLPIGHGQTISQPFIVALMTDLLAPQADDRVLEVGTGSGYQTAVLASLCAQVYSIDVVAALTASAAARLAELGYDNVHTATRSGYQGWPAHAPYDGIIVTAAAPYIPDALLEQLKPGSRLVIPVGEPYGPQALMLLSKDAQGVTERRRILDVAFVPLIERPGPTSA